MFGLLTSKFSSLFSKLIRKGTLTQADINQALDVVRQALIDADVPYEVMTAFCAEISAEVLGQKVLASLKPTEQLISVMHTKMKQFLGSSTAQLALPIPSTILMMGLQGSGKTTTVGKLALQLKNEWESKGKARKILLGSVDFYRPAAIDQLEIVAQQAGVSFYRAQSKDPITAAREISDYSKKEGFEFLFLDTAGRLHVDTALLEELKAIELYVKPRSKILVLDAMTGQESLSVARAFESVVGFDGAILSKMDSDTRGGAAFAFAYTMKKPIWYMGMGEKLNDLEAFHPERIANRILGMGDMATLIEKANAQIKQAEQEALYKSVSSGNFTLHDFAQQLEMMKKMGSLASMVKYIPGMGNSLSPDMIEKSAVELKKFRAIIHSMTPKERVIPHIINGSRKTRIAKGAGVQSADVTLLLQRFEQSQQYVKLLKKFGRVPGVFK